MSEISPLRKEIERLLAMHPHGLTVHQIIERTEGGPDVVRSILGRMRDSGLIRSSHPGKHNTVYSFKPPKEDKEPSMADPNRINKMAGVYNPERDNPSAPRRPNCDQSDQCGSRIGDVVYYRDKTIAYL